MRIRWLRARLLVGAILSLFAVAGTTAIVASPAYAANTLYPSGCRQVTTNSWSTSCWVGHNYARISVGVMAVQYVLQDTGFPPGPIDCIFAHAQTTPPLRTSES